MFQNKLGTAKLELEILTFLNFAAKRDEEGGNGDKKTLKLSCSQMTTISIPTCSILHA